MAFSRNSKFLIKIIFDPTSHHIQKNQSRSITYLNAISKIIKLLEDNIAEYLHNLQVEEHLKLGPQKA